MQDLTKIKAFTFDVDGVFTDGGILCDTAGELYRTYNAKDGFAVRMATWHGYPVGIITGGRSKSIPARFATCGITEADIYLHSRIKSEDFMTFCKSHDLSPDEVMFIGDDLPDIEVLQICGLSVCPSDAADEVKAVCDIVSDYPGGNGCVRKAVESVLKAQGKWVFDSVQYKKFF
ncbi:MAG: HAD hydrolase family protein [Bacteroidales bacterium]|nr:HAD hydrolase family protein [Bacteroidales bacterium]